MSQIGPSTPPNVTHGPPVTNLTLVVLLLIPCVVALLLLNCLFLGYKVMALSKRSRRRKDLAEELLLRSTLRRAGGGSGAAFLVDVPPPPVTSSRASSRERTGADRGIRLLRTDCNTGSGSLRFPSTIRATSSAGGGFNPRVERPRGTRRIGGADWCQSAPVLPRSSDSEADTRVNLVPPNSPMGSEGSGHVHRSGTYRLLPEGNMGVAMHVFDKVDVLCEYTNPPSEVSCTDTSAAASGLDSDFGASAGVSLRILSADSDGLSNGVLASALEWDYYDPCYVKQNNVPKHKHHRPAVHIKQYWV